MLLASGLASATPAATLSVDEATVESGERVDIAIRAEGLENVRAGGFDLVYDTDALTYLEIEVENSLLADFAAVDAHAAQTAQRVGFYAGGASGITGDGVLLVLRFRVEATEGTYPIVLQDTTDALAGATALAGAVNVGAPATDTPRQTETPIPTPTIDTPVASPTPDFDANNDGRVDSNDLLQFIEQWHK